MTRFSDEAIGCEECIGQGFTMSTDHVGQDKDGIILNPGKFESEPLATYHAYHFMLDGFDDESDENAWLVGNMICEENEFGFISSDIYETDEAARATWDRLVAIEYTNQQQG